MSFQSGEANDAPWYSDSTALSHMTPSEGILTFKTPYQGTTNVVVGDGATLPVSHVGQAQLKTSTKPLHLKNVLHVPYLQYKLLSIQQLCNDNNCTVNFDASFVYIKGKATGTTILEGASDRGVYMNSPPFHQAFAILRVFWDT